MYAYDRAAAAAGLKGLLQFFELQTRPTSNVVGRAPTGL